MNKKKSFLILIAVILVLLVSYISHSRYTQDVVASDSAYIAQFVFTQNMTENISLKLDDIKPGDIKTYEFTIANTKDTKVADVGIDYTITLKSSKNLPLTISLYKNQENTDIFSVLEQGVSSEKVLETRNTKIKCR